jgi:signal transduction histidine kinase
MKKTPATISKKIALLNETTTASLLEGSVTSLIKNFTEASIKVLDADFGFTWCRFNENEPPKLMYKSSLSPLDTSIPTVKKNAKVTNDIVIRLNSGEHVYGCIVLGYKKKHVFQEEELSLVQTIANIVVQAITINWLIEKEQRIINLVKKQKETDVLLQEEKLKTEFISNATHEFRTPLAIMRGNVDLALYDKNNSVDTLRNSLKEVGKEIVHLSNLITDLALLTNPNIQEKEKIDFQPIVLQEFLETIITRLGILVERKQIDLQLSVKPKNLTVLGDDKYLDKVFLNLIRNAITYGGENAKIKVEAKKEKNKVVIKVMDNGIGISKKELPRLFERFFRTEKARQMSSIGTGLGLAIVKQITEVHGGTVAVESEEGKGTTFTVTLPIAPSKIAKSK